MPRELGQATSNLIIFLGIEFNTLTMEMRLPDEKRDQLHVLIHWWLSCKRSTKKRELLSLIGESSYACKVVSPGSVFVMSHQPLVPSPYINDDIRLNDEAKANLKWWDLFLDEWNGVSMLKSQLD